MNHSTTTSENSRFWLAGRCGTTWQHVTMTTRINNTINSACIYTTLLLLTHTRNRTERELKSRLIRLRTLRRLRRLRRLRSLICWIFCCSDLVVYYAFIVNRFFSMSKWKCVWDSLLFSLGESGGTTPDISLRVFHSQLSHNRFSLFNADATGFLQLCTEKTHTILW